MTAKKKTTQPANRIERIKLSDGEWADVRRMNAGDLRAVALAAHERGFGNDGLDALEVLPRVITSWSLGMPITRDAIDELIEADVVAVYAYCKLGVVQDA